MLSFWEKDVFLNYDQIVLGGGIVGLSTAISLKEIKPSAKVLVLERSTFPSGASTKNAGFACFGSLTEILSDLKTMSREEVLELVNVRWGGLKLLRSRLGDEAMDYQNNGGYELLSDNELPALDRLDEANDLLYPLFEQLVYQKVDDYKHFGFGQDIVKSVVFNPLEGQIHTGKMMKGLYQLATELGVEILTGTEVESFEESGNGVCVKTVDGIEFKAEQVAVCTNAFTKDLLPEVDLKPGRGSVLITKPIADLPFKGTFHYDEGFYYFRNYEDRVIFGGGRNLDLAGEETTDFEVRELIINKLVNDLKELILPGRDFEIEHTWSGIMAFGENKQPIVKQLSNRIHLGVRLGGMGVAIGSKLGQRLAQNMLG